jgi:hypothetical protein
MTVLVGLMPPAVTSQAGAALIEIEDELSERCDSAFLQ